MSDNQLSTKEKIHYTNLWCRSIGIKSLDLTEHPKIDDVIFLIKFRQSVWYDMNNTERGIWSGIWSWVYHNKYTLTKKNLGKLEKIASNVIYRQQLHQQQRQKLCLLERLKLPQ